MKPIILIPARSGSTRFPKKPLAKILDKTLIERVWQIAKSALNQNQIWIATDDLEIKKYAESFGAQVAWTSGEYENGSERCYAALEQNQIQADFILNLQGDAVLTPPWILRDLIESYQKNPVSEMIWTPAVALENEALDEFLNFKKSGLVSGTTVVFDHNLKALYFSKGLIPFERNQLPGVTRFYRHIGVYGYTFQALKKYFSFPSCSLEKIEGLEQLRAIYYGMQIQVVLVNYRGRSHWSIDNPEDIEVVERLIRKEGELIL